MKKQIRNRIWIIVFLVLLLSIVALILVGNFLVDFALNKDSRYGLDFSSDEDGERTEEDITKELFRLYADDWIANSEKDRIVITSGDGLDLVANYYPKDSNKYVILVHGYKGQKEDMELTGSVYAIWGYNVLTPDNRAHGESDGKMIGMGWLDAKDILKWIEYIISQDDDAEIVLHGVSMGGATVMMVSGYDLPENVKAIVEDCGYSSVWDIFSDQLSEVFGLPDFPILYVSSLLSKIRAGYFFGEASSLAQLEKSRLPMLFIHGQEDKFVGYYMLDLNVEAKKKGDKQVLRVSGAEHANSNIVDPELYYKTIYRFISNYVQ